MGLKWRLTLLLLLLLVAIVALGMSRLPFSLTQLQGITLASSQLGISQLQLTLNGCDKLRIDGLQLKLSGSPTQLHMQALAFHACPSAPNTAPPALQLPDWFPSLALQITQLSVNTLPAMKLRLDYSKPQKRLQGSIDSTYGEAQLIWQRANQHCNLSLKGDELQLKLSGFCQPETLDFALSGLGRVAHLPLSLRLQANQKAVSAMCKLTPATGESSQLLLSSEWSQPQGSVQAIYSGAWGRLSADYQHQSGLSPQLAGQFSVRGQLAHNSHFHQQDAANQQKASSQQGALSQQKALSQKKAFNQQKAAFSLKGAVAGALKMPSLSLSPDSYLQSTLPYVGQLRLRPTTAWQIDYSQQGFNFHLPAQIETKGLAAQLTLSGELSGTLAGSFREQQLSAQGKFESQINTPQLQTATLFLPFSLTGPLTQPIIELSAESRLQADRLSYAQWQLNHPELQLTQPMRLAIAERRHTPLNLAFSSQGVNYAELTSPAFQTRLLVTQQAASDWHYQLQLHQLGTRLSLNGAIQPDASQYNYQLELDQQTPWQSLLPEPFQLHSTQLQLTGAGQWQFSDPPYSEGLLTLQNTDFTADNIPVIGLAAEIHYQFRQQTLSASGQLQAAQINPGVKLEQLTTQFRLANQPQPKLELTELSASLLGGDIRLDKLSYPEQLQPVPLQIKGLSLHELAQLQQEPVVTLSGDIDSQLPLVFEQGQFSIRGGKLANRTPVRLKLLPSNAAQRWLSSQSQLKQVGEYLSHLEIGRLHANINFDPQGWLQLNSEINGVNPELNYQPVRLNYQHNENIYQLLQSLRLSSEFEQQIEEIINRNQERKPLP